LRGFFCPALGVRPQRSGEGLAAPDGPATGLSSRGAIGMDGDREDRDRGGSASAPSMALTGEQDSLLIWRYSSRRGVCGDGGPAVMGESDWRGAGGVSVAGRGWFLTVCLGGVTCLRGLEYSQWGPGVDCRRRVRDSLGVLSRRDLLGDGPRTLEEGVLDCVVDTDLWSLERRRGVRARLWAGRRLPMLVEIL
jgi:hypothetical protein